MRIARSIVAAGVAFAAACSGPKFTAEDCDEGDCAGASSGGTSSGGTSAGKGGAAGTSSGGAPTGGSSNGGSTTGGVATGGTASGGFSAQSGSAGAANAGSAGSGTAAFPMYGILDRFSREGPELGLDWLGGTASYELSAQTLSCAANDCQELFWSQAFGVSQEVFATLVSFSSESREINLILKAQQISNCDLIELFYSPLDGRLFVEGCWDGDWHTLGFVDIVLDAGDELGGRVGADGFIDLFRNRIQVGRFDANDYPFIDRGGRIGVNGIVATDAEPNVWDDFGGGGPP